MIGFNDPVIHQLSVRMRFPHLPFPVVPVFFKLVNAQGYGGAFTVVDDTKDYRVGSVLFHSPGIENDFDTCHKWMWLWQQT